MPDLLSLFRDKRPVGSTPKTTTPSSVAPVTESPERSGQAPTITAGTAYEVVMPVPSPVITLPATLYAPGASGPGGYFWGSFPGTDTTGWHFTEVVSTSPDAPAVASPPSTFFVLETTTNPKNSVDGTLPDRLYKAFTKGAR